MPINRIVLSRFYNRSKSLNELSGEKVLILAPHVDDETIGLGGTVLKHVANGHKVTCVYVTDGSKSVSSMAKEELVEERKKEAKKVQKLLGIEKLYFMNLPDGEVESTVDAQEVLKGIIQDVNPNVIYCPIFIDCHPDHISTGRILSDVLKEVSYKGNIRLYEINCPIPPDIINYVIDITDVFQKKEKALGVFQSQAIDFDGFIELSKIKAQLQNNRQIKAVETFWQVTPKDFIQRFDCLDKERIQYQQYFKQVNKSATLVWGIKQNFQTKLEFYAKSINRGDK